MTGDASVLLALGGAYAALAVMPGPSFLMVSQLSLNAPRSHACLAALGVAIGVALLAAMTLSGTLALPATSRLRFLVDLAFGALLVWLGSKAIARMRLAIEALPLVPQVTAGQCLRLGFVTAVLNPMTSVFFLGLGSGVLGKQAAAPFMAALTIFAVALFWFGGVALSFSHPRVQRLHRRSARFIDGLVGVVLLALGIRTIMAGLLGQ